MKHSSLTIHNQLPNNPQVKELFGLLGQVQEVRMNDSKKTGRNGGPATKFCFVEFGSEDSVRLQAKAKAKPKHTTKTHNPQKN